MIELTPEERALVLKTRAHWVRMRDDPEGRGKKPGMRSCPLCKKYLGERGHRCELCVVTRAAGGTYCEETPEEYAQDQYDRMKDEKPGTEWRRLLAESFGKAAGCVVDWIDENLLDGAPTEAEIGGGSCG